MDVKILSSSSNEVSLSITKSDVATLYIIQHELLKGSNIEFAGVVEKLQKNSKCVSTRQKETLSKK